MNAGARLQEHSLAESYAAAARVVARVIDGAALNAALGVEPGTGTLRAATQDLAYQTLRAYGWVQAVAERLVERPVRQPQVYALLLVSLCSLEAGGSATYTAVHQAVEAVEMLGVPRTRGLVNAVLRAYLRRAAELKLELAGIETARYRHPQWWIDRVRTAHPTHWMSILENGNVHPPMGLRVNRRKVSVDAYLERLRGGGIGGVLAGDAGVVLDRPRPVMTLPGFREGYVSVQDVGAQHAAPFLDVRPGMRVLDACAAPGGKTGHILELVDCDVTAMDVSAERTRRVEENLERLGLRAEVLAGDAARADSVLRGRRFERILIDAPCSASGVVRRHPDAKWLRRPSDLARFAAVQDQLLESLWRLLEPDGKLLYATCSVFPEENGDRVAGFLARHPEARSLALPPAAGIENGQILPGAISDGFYYALLTKTP
jgi:16S rRNA (cytosine967-C5)-methyltransferase